MEEGEVGGGYKRRRKMTRAVGCGGWRNSVSHEIELAVCNTFGSEDVAAVISSCTPTKRRKFSAFSRARASASGIFTINHGDEF